MSLKTSEKATLTNRTEQRFIRLCVDFKNIDRNDTIDRERRKNIDIFRDLHDS